MTAKITEQIVALSSMIDGINIGIERARELREKILFSATGDTLGLDALIELLRKDKAELKEAMSVLQKEL